MNEGSNDRYLILIAVIDSLLVTLSQKKGVWKEFQSSANIQSCTNDSNCILEFNLTVFVCDRFSSNSFNIRIMNKSKIVFNEKFYTYSQNGYKCIPYIFFFDPATYSIASFLSHENNNEQLRLLFLLFPIDIFIILICAKKYNLITY